MKAPKPINKAHAAKMKRLKDGAKADKKRQPAKGDVSLRGAGKNAGGRNAKIHNQVNSSFN